MDQEKIDQLFKGEEEPPKLEIPDGTVLEALMQDEHVMFTGRVEDSNGDTLFLVESEGLSVPPVPFGTEVKLRGTLMTGRLVVYHATVLGSRDDRWKVGEVCDWYGWERRNFFRQPMSVEARVMRVKRSQPRCTIGMDVKVACRLMDISGNGVRLACSQEFLWDDQLNVTDAVLIPGEKPFSFLCSVKRIEKARNNLIYGCEFFGLDSKEQDRLVHSVFRLQALARKKRAEMD